jgi:UDP-glucose 4-epimerase
MCRSALLGDASGADHLAAAPVLSLSDVAVALGVRPLDLPAGLVRPLVTASWMTRLQPIDPGWFDPARAVPTLAVDRARDELGWRPSYDARQALTELLTGLRHRHGGSTPRLRSRHGRPRELVTGRQGAAEIRP